VTGPDPTRAGTSGRASSGVAAWRPGLLFGALYFLQGIGDPTEGLLAQPVRSMLRSWGSDAGAIATFSALVAIPWAFKPAYGLITDFLPLFGTRRRGYLALAGGASAASLLGLAAFPPRPGATVALLGLLAVATAAVALADVAADALMIEQGQPLGLTGTLQSVQWGCLYAAGIVNGQVGGALSASHRETWSFWICGAGGLLVLALSLAIVREPAPAAGRAKPGATMAALATALRPGPGSILGVGAFLFLWNFNPFSNAVLYVHLTGGLHLGEAAFGHVVTLTSVASIAASIAYGSICRRIPPRALVHLSIVLGIVSTLGYAAVVDERSVVPVALATGATYMIATLIQLDLAARACPPAVAGTVFASIMALENLGASASTWLGGLLYQSGLERWGPRLSFQVLVVVGSASTACCWLLVPLLPRGPFDPGPPVDRPGSAGG
jgi:hypothetical protein